MHSRVSSRSRCRGTRATTSTSGCTRRTARRRSRIRTTTNAGGKLDVDARNKDHPVENIYWPVDSEPPRGTYRAAVKNYKSSGEPVEFLVRISIHGGVPQCVLGVAHEVGVEVEVVTFTY